MKIVTFVLVMFMCVYGENTTAVLNATENPIANNTTLLTATVASQAVGIVNAGNSSTSANTNDPYAKNKTHSSEYNASTTGPDIITQPGNYDVIHVLDKNNESFICIRKNATNEIETLETTTSSNDMTTAFSENTSIYTENSILSNPNWTCTPNKTDDYYYDEYAYFNYPEYIAGKALFQYLSPVVLIVGVVFNILNFVVLTCTNMRKTSASLYLAVLAICDNINLLMTLTNHWLIQLFNIEYRKTNDALCRISLFLAYFLAHLSAWLLVAVTAERVVTVMFPMRARDWCTLKTATINILILTAVIFVLNMHIFFVSGSGIIMWNGELWPVSCYSYNDDKHFNWKQNIWPWIDFAFAAFIPFTLILICNIIIISVVTKAHQRRRANMNVQDERDDATRSMTIMLIAVSLTFVILTLPITIYYILDAQITGDNPYESHQHVADMRLFRSLATQLFFINCGINFLLYCITGKRYRTELVKLFCCRRVEKRHAPRTTGATYITSDTKSASQVTSFTTIENKTAVSLVENGGAPQNNSDANKDESTKF
ncbi:unnamed protein product [Owenia fusiformis]|uniref:Uncharacterized protein n=1 Tax=Owenia fusiformis TaxID=6347 RepID=A0A8J1Y258_OWEFU|nr:unnamed protein product [Owenia fusiformis]